MTAPLKSLPLQERPRERLIRYGSEALSTVELLAILLGTGTKNRSVLQLAAELLGTFGSMNALCEATLAELCQVKGIGKAKAVGLKAAFGLIGRTEPRKPGLLINSPGKVYELIRGELADQKIEMLMVVLRDVRCCLLHREIIAKGTLTELLMHPREIFHVAIRHRAHSLIIAHNHPSGESAPSTKDVETTMLLVSAGKMIGIELSDHLILGRDSFTSFYQKGFFRTEKSSVY
ncbi:MAG: DNA repair protein RadC [Chlamydiota bacterium]